MAPSPKNHYATSTAEALAAGQDKHYKSPQRKLVLFFAKSRDAWKTKCLEAKTAVKRLKNTVRFLESSQEHWKSRVKALERELAQLQARARDREGEIALLKKRWLYRIWCGGILQICGDGSQFAVLPRLNDRKLSQSGLESLSIVCRRSILMLFSHN